jgi:hypothetical protein
MPRPHATEEQHAEYAAAMKQGGQLILDFRAKYSHAVLDACRLRFFENK